MLNALKLVLVLPLLLTIYSCEKPDNIDESSEKQYDGIHAGEIESAYFVDVNDSVITSYGDEKHILDINGDGINNFEFVSHYSHYFGGMNRRYHCTIKPINNTEIISDTTIKAVNKYTYQMLADSTSIGDTLIVMFDEITPMILSRNDFIDESSNWFNGDEVKFCYYFNNLSGDIPPITNVTYDFQGWNELDDKYLGFRIIRDNETIYGWLQIKINNYNQIHIVNTAFRRGK